MRVLQYKAESFVLSEMFMFQLGEFLDRPQSDSCPGGPFDHGYSGADHPNCGHGR